MKRFVLLLTVLVGALTAQASGGSDYPYLTFETTDGAKASIPVSSLTMTINGNTLTVGDQQFTLMNLAKMYFSTNDETSGIGEELSVKSDEITEIYDLQGKRISGSMVKNAIKREQSSSLELPSASILREANGQLPKGVYIVKTKEKTYKMMVR